MPFGGGWPSSPGRPAAPAGASLRRSAKPAQRSCAPAAVLYPATRSLTTTDRDHRGDRRARRRSSAASGIAIAVDHLDAGEVRALADRIRDDYGHIDVLVNDIWGAEVLKGGPADWNTPIWEHDLDDGPAHPPARASTPT